VIAWLIYYFKKYYFKKKGGHGQGLHELKRTIIGGLPDQSSPDQTSPVQSRLVQSNPTIFILGLTTWAEGLSTDLLGRPREFTFGLRG